MKGKLIKRDNDFYSLIVDGLVMATSNGMIVDYKLSIKNCEAIANGYDLDELVKERFGEAFWHDGDKYFKEGFQKALSLLGDKKFSKYDMLDFTEFFMNLTDKSKPFQKLKDWESLQQNCWDVEIVMGTNYRHIDCVDMGDLVKSKIVKDNEVPMLDSEGCLILKRIR